MSQPNTQQKGRVCAPGLHQKTQLNHSFKAPNQQPPFIGVHGLLQRLDRVRQTKPGHWTARCPARDDKTPSLSIRELEDGRVLLHDFGGSDYLDILAAVGVAPIELIPDHLRHKHASAEPYRAPLPCCDAVRVIAFQASVVLIAGHDIASGKTLGDVALRQLARAVQTIDSALRMVGVKP